MSTPTRPLSIAVFGDTHGHLRLMVQLCRLWQLEHGVHLDLVLQCGDLGFFPETGSLDKATRRYADRDPEELGFARFFARGGAIEHDPMLEKALNGPPDDLNTVRCPVLWCHGNHEDFHHLREAVGSSDLVAVDRFGRLRYLQPGRVVEASLVEGPPVPGFERLLRLRTDRTSMVLPKEAELIGAADDDSDGRVLRLASAGGGPEREGTPDDDWGGEEPLGWVGSRSCFRLRGGAFDVLMSHCAPKQPERGLWFGSDRLRTVVDTVRPLYSFFAHHGRPIPTSMIGRTRAVWLADVNFERNTGPGAFPYGRLTEGCMGLLTWVDSELNDFEIVDEGWMKAITWRSWRHF